MNKLRKNTGRTFRFPFDIDRRIFLLLSIFFFVLAIQPVNNFLFPRLTPDTIAHKIDNYFQDQYEDFNETIEELTKEDVSFLSYQKSKFIDYNKKSWSFVVLKNDSVVFWSKSISKPQIVDLPFDSLISYSNQSEVGLCVKKKKIIGGDTLQIIGKFPAYRQYKLENNFFKSHFSFLSPSSSEKEDFGYKLQPISINIPGRKVVKVMDAPRFELVEKTSFLDLTDKNFWRFFLAAIPFIMFGVSIHTFFKVSVKENPPLYFSLLILTVLIIRGMGYIFYFPDNFSEFYLFNPTLYASCGLNISLGDIFINACLLFWILFFYIMNVQNKIFTIKRSISKIIFILFCSLVLIGFAFISVFNIQSVINDSLLNFDTTNYNHVSPESIIGLGTMLLTFMNYVLFVIIYNRYFERYFEKNIIKYFIPLLGIIGSYLLFENEVLSIMSIACIWTSITLYLLSVKFLSTKFDFNSYKLIYWLIYLSASCVFIIYFIDSNKEIKLRQSFAENLIHFENKNTENGLIELGADLKNDTNLAHFSNRNDFLKYLNHEYLIRFESEYVTRSAALDLKIDTCYTIKEKVPTLTNYRIIHEDNPTIFLKDNIGKEEYEFRQVFNNYSLVVHISPKFNYNLLADPQLNNDLETSKENITRKYKFGYYINGRLVEQSGIDDFPLILSKHAYNQMGKVNLDNKWSSNDVIAHVKIGKDQKSVVIRQNNNIGYKLSTTYAYIFTIIFLLMSLYILGNIIARSNLRRKRFINLLGLTLRMRIHLSILLVELISLTIIGTITIVVLASNAKTNAYNHASIASLEINRAIQQTELNGKFELNTGDSLDIDNFKSLIDPYLDKHSVGLNLYDLNGFRIYTTVSKRIGKILPNLINPKALTELKLKRNISTLQDEHIGNLEYYTIYSNLRDNKGKLSGILEIPNYSSKQTIRQNNSRIITMLINIYAFVFLLSSLFAVYITQRLTKSFSKIVTQFSKINLTQTNQPLQWPYSDEIGLLIKEYNRTLVKLENSTALLAKSERELAWREMARQIAHEIKNPLTPMSLSLQSLQAAIKRKDPNVPQLTEKMTKTVLEQIKVLTRTASNFSEFATMTDIDARKESLLDILESTTGIYSDSDDAEFLFVLPKKDIKVHVDKVKLIRVLTNIIQNSIQSIPDDKVGQIMLTVTKQAKNFVDVAIQDNGVGIPEEFVRKVFEPNFTTKSSGSGLGLAMCKDIMTKTGGNIYFESKVNEGSTFHILIPVFKEEEGD